MTNVFEYEIGGKKFVQKPLVLGQIELLAPIILKLTTGLSPDAVSEIAKIAQPSEQQPGQEEGLNAIFEIVDYLATRKKMAEALSIILIEEGTNPDNRLMEEVQNHLRWHIGIPEGTKVIQDFLACNDWKSLGDVLSLGGMTIPTTPEMTSKQLTEKNEID